jgi:hypothetical protein
LCIKIQTSFLYFTGFSTHLQFAITKLHAFSYNKSPLLQTTQRPAQCASRIAAFFIRQKPSLTDDATPGAMHFAHCCFLPPAKALSYRRHSARERYRRPIPEKPWNSSFDGAAGGRPSLNHL